MGPRGPRCAGRRGGVSGPPVSGSSSLYSIFGSAGKAAGITGSCLEQEKYHWHIYPGIRTCLNGDIYIVEIGKKYCNTIRRRTTATQPEDSERTEPKSRGKCALYAALCTPSCVH